MCKKVEQLIKKCYESKYVLTISILVVILVTAFIICTITTIQKQWEEILAYPEDEYQALETEVNRMIDNNDFTTIYHCSIEYDNEINYLEIELSEGNAYLNANVENYRMENQQKSLKRNYENNVEYIVRHVIFGWLILRALLGGMIFLILSYIIYNRMSKYNIKNKE